MLAEPVPLLDIGDQIAGRSDDGFHSGGRHRALQVRGDLNISSVPHLGAAVQPPGESTRGRKPQLDAGAGQNKLVTVQGNSVDFRQGGGVRDLDLHDVGSAHHHR